MQWKALQAFVYQVRRGHIGGIILIRLVAIYDHFLNTPHFFQTRTIRLFYVNNLNQIIWHLTLTLIFTPNTSPDEDFDQKEILFVAASGKWWLYYMLLYCIFNHLHLFYVHLKIYCNPMFVWISLNSTPVHLLLDPSHQAKIITVKRLIQGRNNVTRVRDKPRSCDQDCRKNNSFTLSATLARFLSWIDTTRVQGNEKKFHQGTESA